MRLVNLCCVVDAKKRRESRVVEVGLVRRFDVLPSRKEQPGTFHMLFLQAGTDP